MKHPIVVTGTDTGIGKTVFCAGLADTMEAAYWKPVQSGLSGETDSDTVRRLGQLPPARVLPEAWRLRTPASPHLAARLDGVEIDPDALQPPLARPLIIEGAGGLMVPLTENRTFIDVFARWRYPVVLCARTELGTINHTLLSLEALGRRAVPILGIAFIGKEDREAERIICTMGKTRRLGRLPFLDPLTPDTLHKAFTSSFRTTDFTAGTDP